MDSPQFDVNQLIRSIMTKQAAQSTPKRLTLDELKGLTSVLSMSGSTLHGLSEAHQGKDADAHLTYQGLGLILDTMVEMIHNIDQLDSKIEELQSKLDQK